MRQGDWLQTYTGKQFYPLDPRPDDIDIQDIAHALSNVGRYNGHAKRFYSVAEHSILVALHVAWHEEPDDDRRRITLAALLHDASEAYLCDVPRPLKRMPEMVGYRSMERAVESVIAECFGLPDPMPAIVVHHDMRALATEYRDLVPNKIHDWRLPEPAWEDMPDGSLKTTASAFTGMLDPAHLWKRTDDPFLWVERLFLAMFVRLTEGRCTPLTSPYYYEAADWLLRCLPDETPLAPKAG